MPFRINRRTSLAIAAGLVFAGTMVGHSSAAPVKITFLYDNNPATIAAAEKLVADFEAKNPDITIETETRPGGGDGDNLIKTRLATGEMNDVFLYNTGSLFQQINPQKNLVDLTSEPWQANVLDSFKSVVTAGGKIYGAPILTAMGGGVLYNKKIFADLGL